MRRVLAIIVPVLLTGCSLLSGQTMEGTSSSSASSAMETQNVSYIGTVTILGPGIATEGTHLLTLDDGRVIFIESDLLTLNDYIGKQILAFGSVRPTSTGNGIVMRVNSVTILTESSDSSSSESSSSEVSSSTTSSSSSSSVATSSAKSVTPVSSAPKSSAPVVSSASAKSIASTAGTSGQVDANVKAMAKVDVSATQWTQQYCSSHIGYCIPIHKNWWYTSFGTTGSSLWHVEASGQEIQKLGDGPIVINLITGSLASRGISDGSVQAQGDFVVAYKEWKDNTHFEVSAPTALKAAVTYMAKSITAYQIAQ